MIRNIYSKKMFIIDLILVSVWALFFSRYCSPGLLLLIPIRIALCFEMQRKSPWTLISAIGFLLAYSCVGNFSGCMVKKLCLGVDVAESEDEKFGVVYAVEFSPERLDFRID